MAKKCKCPKPKKELTAPFYLLTYGDLMTLLMTFFVLLFSMSTIQIIKFQAQIGVIQGTLGITKMYEHAPMQRELPAPAAKQKIKVTTRVQKDNNENSKASSETKPVEVQQVMAQQEDARIKSVQALGTRGDLNIMHHPDELVLVLPTYGVFDKGEYTIDVNSPEVQKAVPLYHELAQQVRNLTNYDVHFIGHTDALPVKKEGKTEGPKDNIELGFLRAKAMYEYFFEKYLPDRSRITFASQGDNVPIIPNASLDSERRKNRRVEIRLKRIRQEAEPE